MAATVKYVDLGRGKACPRAGKSIWFISFRSISFRRFFQWPHRSASQALPGVAIGSHVRNFGADWPSISPISFFFCPVGHYYCFHWGTDVSYLYTNAPCDLPETSFIVSVIVRNEIALNVTLEFSKKSWAFKNTRIECRLVSFESSSSGLPTVKISLLRVEPFEFQQLLRKVRFSCSRNGHEKFKKFYAIMEHSDQLLLGLI